MARPTGVVNEAIEHAMMIQEKAVDILLVEDDANDAALTLRRLCVESKSEGIRLKAAEAWESAGAMIDRPMVLVEPEIWIDEAELESLLATLPAGVEVVVVTR